MNNFRYYNENISRKMVITAAGVVPCGGPKRFPLTPSLVQITFSVWSFEISECILRNYKFSLPV